MRMRLLLSVMVLLGSLAAWFPGDAASFCGSRIVRDYEAPLRALPPANPVPRLLPFAPPGLEVIAFRSTGEGLIYRGLRPSLNLWGNGMGTELNWTVRLLVSRPAADGSVGEVVSETTAWVESVGSLNSVVAKRALVQPGSYRVDTTIESQSGEVLGSYFEYVQVVPALDRVRLGLSRRVIPPGGRFKMRIENVGTREMSYGYRYGLERHHAGRWQPVPLNRGFFAPKLYLHAGEASACQGVRLSPEAKLGLYRIAKVVSLSPISSESGWAPPMAEERLISQTFWVRAKAKPTA